MLAVSSTDDVVVTSSESVVRPRSAEESYRGRRVGVATGDVCQVLFWMQRMAGVSTVELGRRLGVSRQTVQHWVHGRRKNPSVDLLGRFAAACGFEVRVVQR